MLLSLFKQFINVRSIFSFHDLMTNQIGCAWANPLSPLDEQILVRPILYRNRKIYSKNLTKHKIYTTLSLYDVPASLPANNKTKNMSQFSLFPHTTAIEVAVKAGFRFGAKGTHTSRTIMFEELNAVLPATTVQSKRQDYLSAIVNDNCLAKPTVSTRRLTNQRLGELYGLDPSIPLFRVFRRLWDVDESCRRLLALLCTVARDPLLASTAPAIINLPDGSEFMRDPVKLALRGVVGERLNDGVLDKVVRNIASSWSQSGHLDGRTFKKRRLVKATPTTVAFALYLAHQVGFRSMDLFTSGWIGLLDSDPSQARELALEAKRIDLIDLRMSGDIIEINLNRLDPGMEGV